MIEPNRAVLEIADERLRNGIFQLADALSKELDQKGANDVDATTSVGHRDGTDQAEAGLADTRI